MNDIQLLQQNVLTRLQDAWEIVNMRGDVITPETRVEMDNVLAEIEQQTAGITDLLGRALQHIENQSAIINELRFQRDQLGQMLNNAHAEASKNTLRNLVNGMAIQFEDLTVEQIQMFLDVMNGEYTGIVNAYDMIAIQDLIEEITGIVYEDQEELRKEAEELNDDRD